MANFDKAIEVILKHEGGWVDDPQDPGGETNFGISMLIIKRENISAQEMGLPNLNPGSMKLMTRDTAKKLYKKFFWDRYGYGNINDDRVATKVFDCSVNCGPGRGHKFAQKVCNSLGQVPELTIDGAFGPKTFASINSQKADEFVKLYVQEMERYYTAIAAADRLKKFLPGWLKRAKWANFGDW